LSINPLFLFVLFSLGYVFGLLLKNPTAGKFLIFGFAGIFIYEAVKDAGLLASTVFVAGIISHHVTASSIIDRLPRLSFGGRSSSKRRKGSRRSQKQRKSEETTDETHRRYQEYADRNRREKPESEPQEKASGSKRKKPDRKSGKAEADLQREKERLQREKDRLDAERRNFDKQQREQKAPPDNRSDEQILNLSGDYSNAGTLRICDTNPHT